MKSMIVQAKKEWLEFRRDRLSLALAFLLPVFSFLLFGYGIRLESKNIPLAVQDYDLSSTSREYIDRLFATNVFVPSQDASAKEAAEAIDLGSAKAALIVPPRFASNIFMGGSSPLQLLIDGTDINNAQVIYNVVKAANLSFLDGMRQQKGEAAASMQGGGAPADLSTSIIPKLRTWFNPQRDELLFIVPGVFGVVLWMYPCLLSAVAASREKEQNTIVRIYASTLSGIDWILGKALLYFVIGMVMAVILLGMTTLLAGLRFVGDPTPLLVATPLFVLCSVLFGILLGVLTNSQTTAVQATSTGGFFPCFLLSGFVYPIENIPFPLSLLSLLVPSSYFIRICRDAFVRGGGWSSVGVDVLMLLIFCVGLLALSWLRVRRMRLRD